MYINIVAGIQRGPGYSPQYFHCQYELLRVLTYMLMYVRRQYHHPKYNLFLRCWYLPYSAVIKIEYTILYHVETSVATTEDVFANEVATECNSLSRLTSKKIELTTHQSNLLLSLSIPVFRLRSSSFRPRSRLLRGECLLS